ncbi:diguanylate cyclase (GGDEF)-like protein [Rhodovulum kholense]|uniref:Diguanylate cyclase (GGDEF)-like protein n=1 Tax=Rhodovulum kholense TaxID=453584 RepID=A0A8E2VKT8_9RHOB|nr:diguanylate cyclase (GGDEF)-like protein [Rhodovulum kholense]
MGRHDAPVPLPAAESGGTSDFERASPQPSEPPSRVRRRAAAEDWSILAPGSVQTSADHLELVQAELELQNQELLEAHAASERERQKYLALFEHLPLPAVVLDRAGVVREANDSAAAVFGFPSVDHLYNRSIYRMLDQDSRSRVHAYLSGSQSRTEAFPQPTAIVPVHVGRPGDGVHLSYHAHLARLPSCAHDGDRVQMLLVDRHADDRQERDLRCRQMLSDATSTLFHAFDLTGNLIFSNQATSALIGNRKGLSVDQRRDFDGLLGSRALDIEVLISGKPASNHGSFAPTPDNRRSFLIQKFPLRDESGKVFAVGGTSTDVSALMAGHNELFAAFSIANDLANRDPLTGLNNRQCFLEHLRSAMAQLDPTSKGLVLGFLDIDAFKDINDGMGHEVGDAILSAFAGRLEEAMGDRACVGRFGGDEFLLFMSDAAPEEAEQILHRTLGEIRSPYEIGGTRVLLTCSIGLSHYPRDAGTAEDLLRAADMALYSAKSNGRDRVFHFKESLRFTSERRLQVFSALRKALCEDSFRLVFQPKFDIADRGRIVGAEALLRWRDPQLGDISPAEFVPLAEANGLYNALDLRVLKLFARQQGDWIRRGLQVPISVNISARSLQTTELVPTVLALLDYHDIPPELLLLEITETGLMNCTTEATRNLANLADAGVRISIDDFGTGYSSLAYLQKLRPSELKIDRSFIAQLNARDGASDSIVRAMLALAESLQLTTVAEGIENEDQLAWLAQNGCGFGQGFLVSPGLEIPAFESLVAA